jgi:hypothetical protein
MSAVIIVFSAIAALFLLAWLGSRYWPDETTPDAGPNLGE